jgi:predicted amidophosphoribosyltransferase
MEVKHDSYCGLNCGACPVGLVNESGDSSLLAKMAEDWGRKPGEIICGGCKSDVTAAFCSRCRMRLCAMQKRLEFCFECPDYPCEKLTAFRNDDAPHHSAIFRNLGEIRDLGVEAWLEVQAARWSCPACGRRFGWYDETCEGCGAELYNSVSEERDLGVSEDGTACDPADRPGS